MPANAYSALWLAVARELDDEFFGLDRRGMKVGSFALICQAVLSCADLDRALKRMLRGFALFLDEVHGELHLEGGDAVVRLTNTISQEDDRRFADETLLILVQSDVLACRPAHSAEACVFSTRASPVRANTP